MTAIGFLNKINAPTLAAAQSLPAAIKISTDDRIEKIVFFHDESTFQANDDQPMQWRQACYDQRVEVLA